MAKIKRRSEINNCRCLARKADFRFLFLWNSETEFLKLSFKCYNSL